MFKVVERKGKNSGQWTLNRIFCLHMNIYSSFSTLIYITVAEVMGYALSPRTAYEPSNTARSYFWAQRQDSSLNTAKCGPILLTPALQILWTSQKPKCLLKVNFAFDKRWYICFIVSLKFQFRVQHNWYYSG